MLPGWGTAAVRAAVIVPVILLVLFAEVFGLLGLLCGLLQNWLTWPGVSYRPCR